MKSQPDTTKEIITAGGMNQVIGALKSRNTSSSHRNIMRRSNVLSAVVP
jgi:hypothetical protein